MTISDTRTLAEKLVDELQVGERSSAGATVVALIGDLGAGKTTFVQFFGEALGVKEKMLSPTFVIEKIYKIGELHGTGRFDHLIHIDAYRLDNPSEIQTLGWDEIVKNPRNLIAVEWADKIATLLPADAIRITFEHRTDDERNITVN